MPCLGSALTRELLERHWPWGAQHENKPRGLRNLRLEGLFPHQDFEKAKRTVLRMGRPGGGAPNVNEHGGRIYKTKEDPLLRFQWGKDLRKCVDNTLRYRMNKEEQAQYKRELDKLVAEKFKQKEKERIDELAKDNALGYTNGKTKSHGVFERIEKDTKAHTKRIRYNDLKTLPNLKPVPRNYKSVHGTSENMKNLHHCQNNATSTTANANAKNVNVVNPFTTTITTTRNNLDRLTPLRDESKETGIELVPLMIEKRRMQSNNHALGTTDVTKNKYVGAPKWVVDGQIYLRELSKQMNSKLNELKELRMKELESTRKHFNTLDNFWGRPGHGAPRSALKKGAIDKLLYGGRLPVAVA
ncbi:uncharacterized protein [Atheta coriaria]|uniref:uncharacterized protein isoform X2 n=1 Tax=Dalotia coriaria TaxID=877792 RepID=UPI0031F39C44